ncbi:FkbM family methyltransferase [Dyadobacter sp. CY347]|uniref:FkbM family methyltransferase n=1 Tax=Dyadobacter sp. CY347 TaxID=2909336 RepID=UPI001F3BAB34|nr:FkbM family methyltransferase [Dyadobacter sp. CY347]MCF2491511.1 FkbM family methyltransferase [Dyadobacter sp. CY347]
MNKIEFLRPISIKGKIRIGKKHDGGYVVYGKNLDSVDVLLAYGVGWDTDFEEKFNEQTGKEVFMFDPTMLKGEQIIDRSALFQLIFQFQLRRATEYFYWAKDWKLKLEKLNSKGVHFVNEGISTKGETKYNTLGCHIEKYGLTNKRLLLKMDIENAEYDIFLDDSTYIHLQNVTQIIIEWHNLKNRLRDLGQILNRLKQDFEVVHIHGNNYGGTFVLYNFMSNNQEDMVLPDVLEMLLVRRNDILPEDYSTDVERYPIADLDYPNNPHNKELAADFCNSFMSP